jgi:pimeloyl-ACP methyl ester carboxylesterase
MTTFVLIHGAWSGSHGFRHVRKLLQSEGHDVFTPCLTGIGERTHLASPLVNLSTHVRDITNHILYEDLCDIVLVGFSYGGFIVTGALEHIANRVKHLVYLDAFVPSHGETLVSHIFGAGRPSIELGENWLMPPSERQYDNKTEGEWMSLRRVPHPTGCLHEPVHLSQALEQFSFTRTYIQATLNPETDIGVDALRRAAMNAKNSPLWRYEALETTHMIASNKPKELTEILKTVAIDS